MNKGCLIKHTLPIVFGCKSSSLFVLGQEIKKIYYNDY